jgi:hypothetical protein
MSRRRAILCTASLLLLATSTPLALANTEILVSRLPFELADLSTGHEGLPVYAKSLAFLPASSIAHQPLISFPHILELNSPQTLSVCLREGQKSPTDLILPLDAAGKARSGLLGGLDRLEGAMGLSMRTVRLSWPASVRPFFQSVAAVVLLDAPNPTQHPTNFHLSTHRAPPSSPHPSLPHLLISANPSFVSSTPGHNQTLDVPFTVLVEPVHFGGVPESTLPFMGVLVGLLAVV